MLLSLLFPAAARPQTADSQRTGASSRAPLVLYDDFNAAQIDPSKWRGFDNSTAFLREAVRELTPSFSASVERNRRLRFSLTAYGQTDSDEGGLGSPFGLAINQPAPVTEISFTVVVKKINAVGCGSNPSDSFAVAEFRGWFFNTELTPQPGSLGDVLAAVNITRRSSDPGATLSVSAFSNRCDDEWCSTQSGLGGTQLGYVEVGEAARLRVKWDQPNHQFIFQLNDEPESVLQYSVSDASPAPYPDKYIGLTWIVPNCTSLPRPTAMVEAEFDDVYLNP